MRFGRYIVGLPSQDHDTLLAPDKRETAKQSLEDKEGVNSTENSDAEAIV